MIIEQQSNQYEVTKNYHVQEWLTLYMETGNPIYAFRAYQNARRFKLPVPEEIMIYFDGVCDGIILIAKNPPAPKDRPAAIAKALNLSKVGPGQGSPFTEYSSLTQNRTLAMETFYRLLEWGERKSEHAYDEIAKEYNSSKSTVRRNYLDYLEIWQEKKNEILNTNMIKNGADGKPMLAAVGTADDMREASIILKLIEGDTYPA